MNEKLVIFGTGLFAEIAFIYFDNFTDYEIICFVEDDQHHQLNNFMERPVLPYSQFSKQYDIQSLYLFIAIGYNKLNQIRTQKYQYFKSKGYKFATFISPYATILPEVEIGEHCFIFENNVIQPKVKIGNNNVIWSGNHIGHHTHIENNNFISSHVVISGNVNIGSNCFIGVNSTINDGIKIIDDILIGSNTLIIRDLLISGTYIGQPAKIIESKKD